MRGSYGRRWSVEGACSTFKGAFGEPVMPNKTAANAAGERAVMVQIYNMLVRMLAA